MILLGEHVVVYGRPAIAAGLPIGLEVEVTTGSGPAVTSDDPLLASDPRPRTLLVEAARLVGLDPERIVAHVRSELPAGRGLDRKSVV